MKSLRRSLLFVPAHEEKRIQKALTLDADTIIFDLEDAVPPEQKARARELSIQACKANPEKDIIIRVNSPSSSFFIQDLEATMDASPSGIMLPKCGDSTLLDSNLATVASLAEQSGTALEILALIESARGIASLKEICELSHPMLAGICFGHADFSLDMGLPDNNSAAGAVLSARTSIPVNAKGFGKTPIDTVCLEIRDTSIIERDIKLGLSLGYEGKLCIHPTQVELVNQLYTPSPEEVQVARAMLEAWEEAQAKGMAVMSYQNKMVDAPVVLQQEKIIARAKRAGILND